MVAPAGDAWACCGAAVEWPTARCTMSFLQVPQGSAGSRSCEPGRLLCAGWIALPLPQVQCFRSGIREPAGQRRRSAWAVVRLLPARHCSRVMTDYPPARSMACRPYGSHVLPIGCPLVGMVQPIEAATLSLQAIVGQHQVEVLPGDVGALPQACPDGGSQAAAHAATFSR